MPVKGLSSLTVWGDKMRDPENKVGIYGKVKLR